MKKTLLVLFCALTGFSAQIKAQDTKVYNDKLVVMIDDESTAPLDATVNVSENADGSINFSLKNFILRIEDEDGVSEMPVGNIDIQNLATQQLEGGMRSFTFSGDLQIAEGDLEGVDMWLGPMLGDIPLSIEGKLTDEKLFVKIGIEMMDQVINVQFGTDDFEATAISALSVKQNKNLTCNLQGARVSKTVKGIYVVNGKKVLK